MKLSLGFSIQLMKMIRGDQSGYGIFSGTSRKVVDQFINDGVLDYHTVGNQQRKIFCPDTNNLRRYLHHKCEIPSLEDYIIFLEKKDTSRSDAVKATSNSKHKNVKVFEGFMINTYEEINCLLNEENFLLKPISGAFTFINNYNDFVIPADVTVVGIEGFENFKMIERQKYLFEGIKPLFVWRYQNSTSIVNWLKLIPNSYLHFGDYDPKGLHIYISEFRLKLNEQRCDFLVPPDLESLLSKNGKRELYESQIENLKNIEFSRFNEISEVFNLLVKYKKGLEQEVLIQ